jgi:ubiquinone/menaquinone biosynthesis C-methylase UbiE
MTDHILDYWSSQAQKHGTNFSASWGDEYAIQLEIETIGKHLTEGDDVLDVGCANGYSLIKQLESNPASLTGVDFSETMIAEAEKNRSACGSPERFTFKVGDVRKLPFKDCSFDVVYTTRTLINLPTWKEQMEGIKECIRVCRSGGHILLSEAFWEPLVSLNAIRAVINLPPLVEHDFNRYLKKPRLHQFLEGEGIDFRTIDFSAIYYLGTRFIRELITNADLCGFYSPINELFFQLETDYSAEGFGIQQVCILEKE